MAVSPVKRLLEFGQSPWLDFIQREMLENGDLRRMVKDWGLRGVTSNPAIFEKAIAHTDDYGMEIAQLARAGHSAQRIYETLAIEDIRTAAELLSPIYEETGGTDGFVSLEVSPRLARDAAATVTEAKRLWSALDRPNVMIKVPGTDEGLTAIRSLLAAGVNVNVTLLFSGDRYREVLDAWFSGLDDALRAGRRINGIASVASFFLSRIDTLIDRELDAVSAAGGARGREARRLRGTVAIASARLAYGVLEDGLASERFHRLATEGAQVQRLLWASTGTKDPAYSPTKYVEPLIGPNTVTTMPLETLQVYDESGEPRARLSGHPEGAESVLAAVAALGIDLKQATSRLLDEGIEKFTQPHDSLLRSLEAARLEARSAPH